MLTILLDPTEDAGTRLTCGELSQVCPHHAHDGGQALLEMLHQLKPQSTDEIRVVTGPGVFGAIRTSALIANAVAYITGCRLAARTSTEKNFQSVQRITPFYGKPPSITIAQKLG